jgi:hypothetical protein
MFCKLAVHFLTRYTSVTYCCTHQKSSSLVSNLIVVHSQELKVDSGHGLDESFVAGGQLELAEEAGTDAAGGGTAQTDLN